MARYTNASGKQKTIGYYVTQEEAGFAYNNAITSNGLESLRKLNKVDSAGRLIPKP